MSDTALPAEIPPARQPRHRREGVPLDGAPDLGLYSAQPPPFAPPVSPASWTQAPDIETAG